MSVAPHPRSARPGPHPDAIRGPSARGAQQAGGNAGAWGLLKVRLPEGARRHMVACLLVGVMTQQTTEPVPLGVRPRNMWRFTAAHAPQYSLPIPACVIDPVAAAKFVPMCIAHDTVRTAWPLSKGAVRMCTCGQALMLARPRFCPLPHTPRHPNQHAYTQALGPVVGGCVRSRRLQVVCRAQSDGLHQPAQATACPEVTWRPHGLQCRPVHGS